MRPHLPPPLIARLASGLFLTAWLIRAAQAAPPLQTRIAAAAATAQSTRNACLGVRPFYWEIGDSCGTQASGSVDRHDHSGPPTYDALTVMAIASASKWPFAAYAVQHTQGHLTPSQISMLNFTSGYADLRFCRRWQTVDQCLAMPGNGVLSPSDIGTFHYGGGHMEQLAHDLGLGNADDAALAAAVRAELGNRIRFTYSQPQPAGGMVMNSASYALFLRKLMRGELLLGSMLQADAVCADPATCPAKATFSPAPPGSGWLYGLGHWIEGPPGTAQAVSSSAGAFGFYPWISADQRWYGIVARRAFGFGAGVPSARCGALIRQAWISGVAQ